MVGAFWFGRFLQIAIHTKVGAMKKNFALYLAILVIVSILMSACSGASAPLAPNCKGGVCVRIQVPGPVRLNEPADIMLRLESDEDIAALGVSLTVDERGVVIEGPRYWNVAAKARVPSFVTGRVRVFREGVWQIVARTGGVPNRPSAEHSIRIGVTRTGWSINPTPEVGPGTPARAASLAAPLPTPPTPRWRPSPTSTPTLTVTPSPIPTPTQQPYPLPR